MPGSPFPCQYLRRCTDPLSAIPVNAAPPRGPANLRSRAIRTRTWTTPAVVASLPRRRRRGRRPTTRLSLRPPCARGILFRTTTATSLQTPGPTTTPWNFCYPFRNAVPVSLDDVRRKLTISRMQFQLNELFRLIRNKSSLRRHRSVAFALGSSQLMYVMFDVDMPSSLVFTLD